MLFRSRDLKGRCRREERLLLAIGARQLAEAHRCCPEAHLHARVLPRPGALRTALASGLAPERLVCLHPASEPEAPTPVEAALCRRWRIETLLLRRSGGPGEVQWRRLANQLGLRLLLLERPTIQEPTNTGASALSLPYDVLLAMLVSSTAGSPTAETAHPPPAHPDDREPRPRHLPATDQLR